MNERVDLRNPAERALAAQFADLVAELAADSPERAARTAAFQRFADAGLPHRRVEDWKYTDLRSLWRDVAPAAAVAPEAPDLSALDVFPAIERTRIVIVNGRFRADLSSPDLPAGVTVEAASGDMPTHLRDDPLTALNAAFQDGGVRIAIAADTAFDRPLEIAHAAVVDDPALISPLVVVEVGARSSVEILESHVGTDTAYQANGVVTLDVGEGAHVRWRRLQSESVSAIHLASFVAHLARDATLDHLAVNRGGALWRWQGWVTVAGEGARADFSGATMLAGNEHGDIKLTLTHAKPHGSSREAFKTVLADKAEGAFQGLIEVARDAQKTDARMMAQALLLSDEAQFASKPELEIFADDVQCGHGSTTGQLDETQLFYLMARGIPRDEASQLLIEAFLDEILDPLEDSAVAVVLRDAIGDWLATRRNGASS